MRKRADILVVEDEADLADLLRHNLVQEGYGCRVCHDGKRALEELARHPPDAVILDRMLPGLPGDEVLSQMRRDVQLRAIPVVMLTAKADESDELVGFALGADDYVTKPFSMKRLLARLAAALRRVETSPADDDAPTLTAGSIRLDSKRFEVTVNDELIPLTATEFRLLKVLMAAHGNVLTREDLIDTAMGNDVVVTQRTIDVHVTALRKKLGKAAGWIQTIRGVGYTCREPG